MLGYQRIYLLVNYSITLEHPPHKWMVFPAWKFHLHGISHGHVWLPKGISLAMWSREWISFELQVWCRQSRQLSCFSDWWPFIWWSGVSNTWVEPGGNHFSRNSHLYIYIYLWYLPSYHVLFLDSFNIFSVMHLVSWDGKSQACCRDLAWASWWCLAPRDRAKQRTDPRNRFIGGTCHKDCIKLM